jgi:hypothetical protein
MSRKHSMGRTEIRTALKVDFDKPAAEQPGLHVRILQLLGTQADGLRIDGIQIVGFHFCNFSLISHSKCLRIFSPVFRDDQEWRDCKDRMPRLDGRPD